jgi:hypothetical protein
MKKILRLSESELVGLVKKIINEKRNFVNQDMVDKILDKISSDGYNTLSDFEKKLLDNPDLEMEENEMVQDCLQSYVEFMFDKSIIKKDKKGNMTSIEGGDLGVWNNNKPPVNTEDCFGRFFDYLSELIESDFFQECEGLDITDVEHLAYNYFINEIRRRMMSDEGDEEMYS